MVSGFAPPHCRQCFPLAPPHGFLRANGGFVRQMKVEAKKRLKLEYTSKPKVDSVWKESRRSSVLVATGDSVADQYFKHCCRECPQKNDGVARRPLTCALNSNFNPEENWKLDVFYGAWPSGVQQKSFTIHKIYVTRFEKILSIKLLPSESSAVFSEFADRFERLRLFLRITGLMSTWSSLLCAETILDTSW
jgi:hypothetical protein